MRRQRPGQARGQGGRVSTSGKSRRRLVSSGNQGESEPSQRSTLGAALIRPARDGGRISSAMLAARAAQARQTVHLVGMIGKTTRE